MASIVLEFLAWVVIEIVFRGLFGWRNTRERSLAIFNMAAVVGALIGLYFSQFILVGVLAALILVSLFIKITIIATNEE